MERKGQICPPSHLPPLDGPRHAPLYRTSRESEHRRGLGAARPSRASLLPHPCSRAPGLAARPASSPAAPADPGEAAPGRPGRSTGSLPSPARCGTQTAYFWVWSATPELIYTQPSGQFCTQSFRAFCSSDGTARVPSSVLTSE